MLTVLTGRRPAVVASSRLAVLLVFCLVPISARGQVYHASLEELATTSSEIVVGTATNSRSYWSDDRSHILTEVTLRVSETLIGDAVAEKVITIPGGRVGNSVYEVSDMPVFLEGEEVVVFLWQDPSGRNLVTGGSQGRIGIDVDERLQRRVVIDAPPMTRAEMETTRGAFTSGNAGATDQVDVRPPGQVMLLDQLVTKIREARER